MSLAVLDFLFHALHLAMIVVNTTFWWFRPTLRWAQIGLALTGLSWFALGPFYGWGYCFLTDWHWQIKEMRGEMDLPASYIEYLLHELSIGPFLREVVDLGTLTVFLISVVGCCWKTWRERSSRVSAGKIQN